jgi:hypothetical protein
MNAEGIGGKLTYNGMCVCVVGDLKEMQWVL